MTKASFSHLSMLSWLFFFFFFFLLVVAFRTQVIVSSICSKKKLHVTSLGHMGILEKLRNWLFVTLTLTGIKGQ